MKIYLSLHSIYKTTSFKIMCHHQSMIFTSEWKEYYFQDKKNSQKLSYPIFLIILNCGHSMLKGISYSSGI